VQGMSSDLRFSFASLFKQTGIRSDISAITDDNVRNTAIVEINNRKGTAIGVLQGFSDERLFSLLREAAGVGV
jgi:hypothetical protein